MATGLCTKCKKVIEIEDGKESTTKNGRKMICGKCKTCGTKVCRFLKKD